MKKVLRLISFIIMLALTLSVCIISTGAAAVTISNGTAWTDTTGGSIQAHGGGILHSFFQFRELPHHICIWETAGIRRPLVHPDMYGCR